MAFREKPSFLRRVLVKLGLVLFGLLFGCLLMEVVLRVAGYSYPEFYQPDDSRGYALRPNMEGWYRKEGAAYIHINNDGLRDREHAISKAADIFRIAIVGDSYPEAFPMPIEESFWSVMGRKLEECQFAGKKIEVMNFGVSGYGTAQELLTIREKVWQYSPDLVMLTVTTNNDISDNLRQLKKTDQIPYFIDRNGELTLDDSFKATSTFRWRQSLPSRFGRWIRDHSRVIQAIVQGHHGFKIWRASRQTHEATPSPSLTGNDNQQPQSATPSEELGIDNVVYREPADQDWKDAWSISEKLFAEMRDEVQAKGARFVIVTLSNGIQVYPNQELRQSFMKRVGASDLFYPDKRIQQFAGAQHIPVITLAPELQTYADQNNAVLHGFGANLGNGHWNQLGHRIAGEAIARQLCAGVIP
jgi:hypothetical protein